MPFLALQLSHTFFYFYVWDLILRSSPVSLQHCVNSHSLSDVNTLVPSHYSLFQLLFSLYLSRHPPDVKDCTGVSVDWNSRHIYWTSPSDKTVEIANYDGSGRRILVGSGLVNPRGIVVDPVFGWVCQSWRHPQSTPLIFYACIVWSQLCPPFSISVDLIERKNGANLILFLSKMVAPGDKLTWGIRAVLNHA